MKILVNSTSKSYPLLKDNKFLQYGAATFHTSLMDALDKEKVEVSEIAINFVDTKEENKGLHLYSRVDNHRWWLIDTHLLNDTKFFYAIEKQEEIDKIIQSYTKHLEELFGLDKPDLVFLDGIDYFIFSIAKIAHKFNVPVVVQHAGIWTKEVKPYEDIYTKASVETAYELEKRLIDFTTKDVFISEFSKNEFMKDVSSKVEGKSTVIYLPLIFKNTKIKKRKNNGILKIAMVARWNRIKNYEKFLEIAKKARELNKNWKFYAVCKPRERDMGKEFIEEFLKYVEVVPQVDHDQIDAFYQQIDHLLVPSIFETASFVTLEALLNYVPVIVSENVGMKEYLRLKGVEEYISDYKDIDKVIVQIEKNTKTKVSKKLVEDIKKDFNPDEIFKKYISLFKKVS